VLATMRQFSVGAVAVVAPLVIISYLTFRSSLGRMEDAEAHVARVDRLYLSTIETLATAIDAKDEVTHGHIRRVQALTLQLAHALGITDQATLKAIEAAALLHDTGKLAVPEHILNKPGKLTAAEFERMKLHASVGADILSNVDFPYPVVPIVRHHHENWDGTGYPAGLKGTEIPIGARILSVVDCFDALTSDRPYRKRLTNEAAIAILLERRGTMYDPQVVDTFISLERRNGLVETAPAISPVIEARTARPGPAAASAPAAQAVDENCDDLVALRTLASVLPADTRPAEALVLVAAHLRALFPVTIAALYAIDREHDEVVLQHAWGRGADALVGRRLASGAGLSGWVAVNRQAIVNSEAGLDLAEQVAVTTPPVACCLSVPLMDGDTLVGVLSLYSSTPDAFTAQHGRLSQLAAPVVARLFGHSLVASPAPKSTVWTGIEPSRQSIH
jgi:putative nucleotidyltransferase with HDIG domain